MEHLKRHTLVFLVWIILHHIYMTEADVLQAVKHQQCFNLYCPDIVGGCKEQVLPSTQDNSKLADHITVNCGTGAEIYSRYMIHIEYFIANSCDMECQHPYTDCICCNTKSEITSRPLCLRAVDSTEQECSGAQCLVHIPQIAIPTSTCQDSSLSALACDDKTSTENCLVRWIRVTYYCIASTTIMPDITTSETSSQLTTRLVTSQPTTLTETLGIYEATSRDRTKSQTNSQLTTPLVAAQHTTEAAPVVYETTAQDYIVTTTNLLPGTQSSPRTGVITTSGTGVSSGQSQSAPITGIAMGVAMGILVVVIIVLVILIVFLKRGNTNKSTPNSPDDAQMGAIRLESYGAGSIEDTYQIIKNKSANKFNESDGNKINLKAKTEVSIGETYYNINDETSQDKITHSFENLDSVNQNVQSHNGQTSTKDLDKNPNENAKHKEHFHNKDETVKEYTKDQCSDVDNPKQELLENTYYEGADIDRDAEDLKVSSYNENNGNNSKAERYLKLDCNSRDSRNENTYIDIMSDKEYKADAATPENQHETYLEILAHSLEDKDVGLKSENIAEEQQPADNCGHTDSKVVNENGDVAGSSHYNDMRTEPLVPNRPAQINQSRQRSGRNDLEGNYVYTYGHFKLEGRSRDPKKNGENF